MWDYTEGIVGTAELTNRETWSYYSNFDSAYSEIADLIVAPIPPNYVFDATFGKVLYLFSHCLTITLTLNVQENVDRHKIITRDSMFMLVTGRFAE